MPIPELKRIRISSKTALRHWLGKNTAQSGELMLVLHSKSSKDKYISREQIHDALQEYGWQSGMRYTFNADLIGHVISKPSSD